MQRQLHRVGERVSGRFRALDRRLHIDHHGRSEWIWAVPILSFAGSFVLVALVGAITAGVSPSLYVPMGLIIAAATAGMSIAYMTPEPDAPGDPGDDDGGQHERPPHPPPSPPRQGWAHWLRDWRERDTELPDEPPAPPRRVDPERERERTSAPR